MPPQVVVVLKLLVADGTDVLGAGWPGCWLHWIQNSQEKKNREKCVTNPCKLLIILYSLDLINSGTLFTATVQDNLTLNTSVCFSNR